MNAAHDTGQHTALRRQGMWFCALALLGLAATNWLSGLSDRTVLIAVATAIFLLGVPHGALDTVFARKLYRVGTPLQWLIFVVVYVLLALLVVLLWWALPRLFMAGFLLISALHFSGDPDIKLSLGVRMLYGSAAIVLPTLLHVPAVTALFAQLVGAQAAADLVAPLQWMSTPLLLGELMLIALALSADWLAGVEIALVVLLSVFASPLIAFTLFFCGMHSPRHFLRTAFLAGESPVTLLVRAALLPTLACLAAAALATVALSGQSIEVRLLRIVFVGLAALTVPHMVLVEQVRYRGAWGALRRAMRSRIRRR